MKAGKGRRVSRPAPKVCLSTGTRRPTLARRVCPTGSRRHANPRRPTPSHFLRDLPARQVRAAFGQTSGTPSGPFSEDRSSPGFCRVGAKQQGVKPASIPPPPPLTYHKMHATHPLHANVPSGTTSKNTTTLGSLERLFVAMMPR